MKKLDYTPENWNFVNMNSPADLYCELTGAPAVRLGEYDRCRDGHCLISSALLNSDCSHTEIEILELHDGAGIGFYYGDGCWDSYILFCILPDRVEVRIPSRVPNGDTFRFEGAERYWIVSGNQIELKVPIKLTLRISDQILSVINGSEQILSVDLSHIRFCTKSPRILMKSLNENHGCPKTEAVFGKCCIDGVENGHTLAGVCIDRETGDTVKGVSVHLAGYANFWAMTDSTGTFQMDHVPYDSYNVIIACEGGSFSNRSIDWQGESLNLFVEPADFDSLRRDAVSGELETNYEKVDLNGVWSFQFDRDGQGERQNWHTGIKSFDKCIRVPYPWTSLAAFGEEFLADEYTLHQANTFFCNRWETGETAWYSRRVFLPRLPRENEVLTLCIGAISGEAMVWLDGVYLGNTLDSYNRFTFPVSVSNNEDNHILTIKVAYKINNHTSCTGKQDFWFTVCPGIWQGVWLEYRPRKQISDLLADYQIDNDHVKLSLVSVCEYKTQTTEEAEIVQKVISSYENAEFHVACREAGIYRVEMEYCAGSGRVAALVSGMEETSIVFEATPNFTLFDRKHFYMRLQSGVNWIKLKKQADCAMLGEPYCVICRATISPVEEAGNVKLNFQGEEFSAAVCLQSSTGAMTAQFTFSFYNPALWTEEHPYLYCITAQMEGINNSRVARTLGIRSFSSGCVNSITETDMQHQSNCFYWNGEPVYIRGVLDQGYNPWGLYTYTGTCSGKPGSMDFDLKAAVNCGYNLIRMHVKDNEPDWYSRCDKQGMLVWDELPVNFFAKSNDPCWRGMYFRQLSAMVRKHNYHPSVVIFSTFNESWGITGDHEKSPWEDAEGQDFIRLAAAEYKEHCKTTLVVDNSGYGKTEMTDIIDYHCYPIGYSDSRNFWERLSLQNYPNSHFNFYHEDNNSLMCNPEIRDLLQRNCSMDLSSLKYVGKSVSSGQPVLISEFVHTDGDEQLVRIFPEFAGFIRMNLSSQENEDTSPLSSVRIRRDFGYVRGDFTSAGYGMINSKNLLYPDAPRLNRVRTADNISIDLYAAIWCSKAEENVKLNWYFTGIDSLGSKIDKMLSGSLDYNLQKYIPKKFGTIEFFVPQNICAAYLFTTLSDSTGILAENEIQFEISDTVESTKGIELHPASAAESNWSGFEGFYCRDKRELAWGDGAGRFVYRLNVPHEYVWKEESTYWLIFEASSCECLCGTRLTDEKRFESTVQVKINNELLGSTMLPDHPCDERAVFSNAAAMDQTGYRYAKTGRYGYGFRVKFPVSASLLKQIKEKGFALVEFESKENGFILYGHRMGRYGCNPMLLPEFKQSVGGNYAVG